MENRRGQARWIWDERRQDWYYLDDNANVRTYGNGRTYPDLGKAE